MAEPLTHFDPDPERLMVIQECMENYEVGSSDAEWPNNIISRRTLVYGSGVIAPQGNPVVHRVDPEELALCKQLSAEACKIMDRTAVGMGSESGDPFRSFFMAANIGDPVPKSIDESFIRSKFGETLFPLVTMTVEPLEESGIWWSEVLRDAGDFEPEEVEDHLNPWKSMIRWFQSNPLLKCPVFVRIGESEFLWEIPKEQYPSGTEITGCVLPRMAVALSEKGSLIGIFGYTVQT